MRQSCKPHPFSAYAGLSLHRSSTKRLPTLELTAQIRKDFQSFPIQLSDTSLRQPHHVPSLSYDNPRGLVRFASGSRLLDPGDSRRQEVQGEIGFIEKFTSERRRDSAPPLGAAVPTHHATDFAKSSFLADPVRYLRRVP